MRRTEALPDDGIAHAGFGPAVPLNDQEFPAEAGFRGKPAQPGGPTGVCQGDAPGPDDDQRQYGREEIAHAQGNQFINLRLQGKHLPFCELGCIHFITEL